MGFQNLLKELAKLTPEEKTALRGVFAPEAADDGVDQVALNEIKADLRNIYPNLSDSSLREMALKQIKTPRTRQAPKAAKAERVYFFEQVSRFVAEDIEPDKENSDIIKKTGYFLPPRVVAVGKKDAWRMYWKRRNVFRFLGSSDGVHWREARERGMKVSEAYGVEFEHMKKNPDLTAPMNREKTVFAGTKIYPGQRGNEIDWSIGLKQTGGS